MAQTAGRTSSSGVSGRREKDNRASAKLRRLANTDENPSQNSGFNRGSYSLRKAMTGSTPIALHVG